MEQNLENNDLSAHSINVDIKVEKNKVKQVQPVWVWTRSGKQFDETYENTQWRKVMQV